MAQQMLSSPLSTGWLQKLLLFSLHLVSEVITKENWMVLQKGVRNPCGWELKGSAILGQVLTSTEWMCKPNKPSNKCENSRIIWLQICPQQWWMGASLWSPELCFSSLWLCRWKVQLSCLVVVCCGIDYTGITWPTDFRSWPIIVRF